jgi:hypothetical protein
MLRKQLQDLHTDAYEALRTPIVSAVFIPPDDPELEDGRAIM